ncbi:MAG: hypothetical protein LBV16_03595 [Elusimicrobiota bacterium]|jgi:hypothetical protein|nr:hypothetical protein [Elusimicrobiota bacterium]
MYRISIFIVFSISFLFSSCAVLDLPSKFLGYSIEKFEDSKATAYEKVFKTSKLTAFKKTENIIAKFKARITNQSFKKGYIIVFDLSKYFDNCLDSTEAAIFIEEIAENQVKIRIVSNNGLLAQNFSDKFFEFFAQRTENWELFPKKEPNEVSDAI